MSFKSENIIVTESKLNEGVTITTVTIETTIESSTTSHQVLYPTHVSKTIPTESYVKGTYITTETYAPVTTDTVASTADKLTPEAITSPLSFDTTLFIQEFEPVETFMISSYTSNNQPATNTSYDSIDATTNNISIALIAGVVIISLIFLVALISVCVILKRDKKKDYINRRVSPILYLPEKDFSSSKYSLNTSVNGTTFYVQSSDYRNSGVRISFIDKPEKLYCNNISNSINTTPLFPPIHRTNQSYNSSIRSTIISRDYSRESSQTMGKSNRYRPSLHDSIFIGSVTTRQNSTCSSYLRQDNSLYSNKQEKHKMTLWDDDLLDAWSTEDKQLA